MNNMPPVVKNLLIINLLCFIASTFNPNINEMLGLHFIGASHFRFYQFFTYMFMHASISHIFFNMFAVWMFGRIMEAQMGSRRFLIYYFACGLGAGVVQEIAQFIHLYNLGYTLDDLAQLSDLLNVWYTVGASGAVYGILLAFGMTFPDERMFVFPIPAPIKAKYFVMGYAVLELLEAMGRPGDGVAHFAHLGGMIFGLALLLHWRHGKGGRGGGNYYNATYDRDESNNRRSWWRKLFGGMKRKKRPDIKVTRGGKYNQDMEYRMRKKKEEEELNEILDKVRKSGYANLTEEEKRRLFDMSKRK